MAFDLTHIRKLADAAQHGPWRVADTVPDKSIRTPAGWEVCYFPYADAASNMAFIAAARSAVPAMCDEIERLREHAHSCSDLTDKVEMLEHALTSARDYSEQLRQRVAELEADLSEDFHSAQRCGKDGPACPGCEIDGLNNDLIMLRLRRANTDSTGEAVKAT